MKRKDDKWSRADDLCGSKDVFESRRGREYHLASLCRQVQRTVSMSLSGECGDPVLQDLVVDRVVPAPDSSRLMVVVYFARPSIAVPLPEVLGKLDAVSGHLRREVVRAITRKRAPEIIFALARPEVSDEY